MSVERFKEFDRLGHQLGLKAGRTDEIWERSSEFREVFKKMLSLMPKYRQGRSRGGYLPDDLVQLTLKSKFGIRMVHISQMFGVTPMTLYAWRNGSRSAPDRHLSSFQALAMRIGKEELIEAWQAQKAGATSDYMSRETRELVSQTLEACARRQGFARGGIVPLDTVLVSLGVKVGRYWNMRRGKAEIAKIEAPKFLKLAQKTKNRQLIAAWLDVIDKM